MAACPVGFVFRPTEAQLMDCLRLKIAGEHYDDSYDFIKDINVYSNAPDVLVAGHAPAPGTGVAGRRKEYYFFTELQYVSAVSAARTRRWRIVDGTDGKGHWHPERRKKTVEGSNAGYLNKFSYRVETASGTMRPGWLMAEYGIEGCDMVICKVYKSPRGPGRAALPSGHSASTSSALPHLAHGDHSVQAGAMGLVELGVPGVLPQLAHGNHSGQGALGLVGNADIAAPGVLPHLAHGDHSVQGAMGVADLGVPGMRPHLAHGDHSVQAGAMGLVELGVPGVLLHLAHGNHSVQGALGLVGNADIAAPAVLPHLAHGDHSVQAGALGLVELDVPGVLPHLAHGGHSVQGALGLVGNAELGAPGVTSHVAHGNQSVQGALGLVGNARLPVPSSWQPSDVVAPHLLQVSPPKRKREDAVGNLELEAAQPPPRARQQQRQHTPRGHGAAEVSAITSTARVGHQQETLPQTAGGESVPLPAAGDVGDDNNPLLLQDYIDFLLLQLPDMEAHDAMTEDAARFLAQSGHGNNGPIMDYGDLAPLAARAAEDELLGNPPMSSEPSGSTYQELVGLPWEC
ncbi:hypothetical protein ACP70R_001438 [Stipagrostis hirtigluma subsp. patula]